MPSWQSVLAVAAALFVLGTLAAPAHAWPMDAARWAVQDAAQPAGTGYDAADPMRSNLGPEFASFEPEIGNAAPRGGEAPCTGF